MCEAYAPYQRPPLLIDHLLPVPKGGLSKEVLLYMFLTIHLIVHASKSTLTITCYSPTVQISFDICDITLTDLPENSFDVIYSRDSILHIKEKLPLFKRYVPSCKGGRACSNLRGMTLVLFSDFHNCHDYFCGLPTQVSRLQLIFDLI